MVGGFHQSARVSSERDLNTYPGQGRLRRAEQRGFLASRTCSLLSVSASTLRCVLFCRGCSSSLLISDWDVGTTTSMVFTTPTRTLNTGFAFHVAVFAGYCDRAATSLLVVALEWFNLNYLGCLKNENVEFSGVILYNATTVTNIPQKPEAPRDRPPSVCCCIQVQGELW